MDCSLVDNGLLEMLMTPLFGLFISPKVPSFCRLNNFFSCLTEMLFLTDLALCLRNSDPRKYDSSEIRVENFDRFSAIIRLGECIWLWQILVFALMHCTLVRSITRLKTA